jgi:hypothetical protein
MAKKRMTDADKWDDPWYSDLPANYKLAWDYICSKCDAVGVWKPSPKHLQFNAGTADIESFLEVCGPERIYVMPNGNWWLLKFCDFQYGKLNEADCLGRKTDGTEYIKNKPHWSYINLLKKHSLWIGYTKGIHTLKETDKEKETEQEQETDKDTAPAFVYSEAEAKPEPVIIPVTIPQDKATVTREILNDEIYMENLTMTHRGKNIAQAWEECWLHFITGESPPRDLAGWKQKLNGWLSNKKHERASKTKQQQRTNGLIEGFSKEYGNGSGFK